MLHVQLPPAQVVAFETDDLAEELRGSEVVVLEKYGCDTTERVFDEQSYV